MRSARLASAGGKPYGRCGRLAANRSPCLPRQISGVDRYGRKSRKSELAPMTAGREVVEDYRSRGLTLRSHPVAFLRGNLAADGYVPAGDLSATRDGRRVAVAGLVLVRQRPGSANGALFVTLEDETDIANLIVWPSLFERQRRLVLSA